MHHNILKARRYKLKYILYALNRSSIELFFLNLYFHSNKYDVIGTFEVMC